VSREPVRFIHASDLQLGMTRTFLDDDAQARYAQARVDTLLSIGRLAKDERAEFVVIAGDVFDSNRVKPRTVGRALEAVAGIEVPVYLLPGNHDPLDAASVYISPTFQRSVPPNVVLLDTAQPREVRPDVEVLGAPWTTRRPLQDLVGETYESLEHQPAKVRIVVGHGAVDSLIDFDNPAVIRLEGAERAIQDGRVQYIALGDRHSTTEVGTSHRIWYSGSPEPTAHDEVDAGNVLAVELDDDRCDVTAHLVGTWRFVSADFEVDEVGGLEELVSLLHSLPSKDRTVVRLTLRGVLSLSRYLELESVLTTSREVFGSIEEWQPTSELIIRPDDDDFSDLGLSGFAKSAVEQLRSTALAGQGDAEVARDALALLVRLSRGQSLEPK
jgi:DNA repair exonuclease SbcCD nuclease subunit